MRTFIRTSHDQRRRSSAIGVTAPEHTQYLSTATDPIARRGSWNSLQPEGLAKYMENRRPSGGLVDRRPSGGLLDPSSQSASFSTSPSTPEKRRPSLAPCTSYVNPPRKRSQTDKPTLRRMGTFYNMELKKTNIAATLIIMLMCFLIVALLSLYLKNTLKIE